MPCQQNASALQVAKSKPPHVPVAHGGGVPWSIPPKHLTSGPLPQSFAITLRSQALSSSTCLVAQRWSAQTGTPRWPWQVVGSVQVAKVAYVACAQSLSCSQQSPSWQHSPLPQ